MNSVSGFLNDRIQVNSLLIVLCFVSVLGLSSQSAASYSTYLLALAMLLTIRQWNDVFSVRLLWAIVTLLAYLTLTSFWSDPFDIREAFSVFARALLVFLFVVAFAECQPRGQLQRWLGRSLAVVGSLATLAAIIVFFVTDPAGGRLNGLGQLDTQVVAALVYGVVLIFVIELIITDKSGIWRAVGVVSGPLIGCAVFLSGSRNAWLSVLIGAGVFLLAHRLRTRRRFVAGVTMMTLVLAGLLAALWANEATREIMLPRGESYRPVIWCSIFAQVVEQGLVFGRGILTDNNVFASNIEFLHPHNMYLSVFHQGGLVGLGFFAIVIVGIIRVLFRHYASPDSKLALGVLGIGLPAFLLDGHELVDKVGSTWFLFWLPASKAIGLAWTSTLNAPAASDD